jgi:SAM-dependent methyltransferase
MSISVIYKSPWLYEAFLILRYRGEYLNRSRAIAELIPEGSSVVDLCCGPATLYFGHLRHKGVAYLGLDINEGFVTRLAKRGVPASLLDVTADSPLPRGDYLVMQGSLYHFLPEPYPIIERMLKAARHNVIITEPVWNLADSKNPALSWLASKLANPGTGDQVSRFNESRFEEFVNRYRARDLVVAYYPVAAGRERLCVLRGGA